MICKPTVGEVRETCLLTRLRVTPWLMDGWQTLLVCSRIVKVAPKNRARVTAGPTWMGER